MAVVILVAVALGMQWSFDRLNRDFRETGSPDQSHLKYVPVIWLGSVLAMVAAGL